jgi:hypothetical protein
MPGSGAIDKNDKWHIEIELNGPVSADRSEKFTKALEAFLKKNKAKMTKGETQQKQPAGHERVGGKAGGNRADGGADPSPRAR